MRWSEFKPEEYNREIASRLRGLAAMVESCDERVKIKIGVNLKWTESGDSYRSAVLPFDEFSDRFTVYTTKKMIEILKKGDPEQAGPIIEKLNSIISQ